ncbi:MAG: AAA family ATPase, partial [Polyangiales bacterium]
ASVSSAYLSTPALVGRDDVLTTLRTGLRRARAAAASGVILRGAPGLGRSRLLDACALEAKTLGARVLRASASAQVRDFDVALALTEHLIEAFPNQALAEQFPQLIEPPPSAAAGPAEPERVRLRLRDPALLRTDPLQLQRSISALMQLVSKLQLLVIAVDDVQRIDAPSAALLAGLIDDTRRGQLFLALTANDEPIHASQVLEVLSRRCELLTLSPLSREQTEALVRSLFGDVPNVAKLADESFALARGNPRDTLAVAQHLVDRGVIRYAAGQWTLPRSYATRDLPQSADDAVRQRIAELDSLARKLAECQALAHTPRLSHEDYRALAAGASAAAVDAAVNTLLSQQALRTDGESYAIANRVWSEALISGLSDEVRLLRHLALSKLFRARGDTAWIPHAFAAGPEEEEAALEGLLAIQHRYTTEPESRHALEQSVAHLIESHHRAFEVAERLQRPPRQVHELRRWLVASSVAATDLNQYWFAAPGWLAQLARDSGLAAWREDHENPDPAARLKQALTRAYEQHQALPEHERVYRVDEAIPRLAEYVAYSIAVGVHSMDQALITSLPGLLEPFAALSPLLDALWQNALGSAETVEACQYERARERWLAVHAKLQHVSESELQHVGAIRNAIAYGIGMIEAVFGLASAANWADRLDQDPLQRVSALYLRKIVRLEQGDWNGADKLQRKAEVLALREHVPQMFTSTLTVEISAHMLALDLAGVKDVVERVRVEAARFPGWEPYLVVSEACFELVRGDFVAAQAAFERAITMTQLNAARRSRCMPVWVGAHSGLCEALLGLDRPAEARATGMHALAICDELQIRTYASDLQRVLALAEARLGEVSAAVARLERLIEAQQTLGVSGLRIGVTYEARAQVAIWSGDGAAFEEYARLTAREYRHGAGCPLGARYERLMREARRYGLRAAIALSDFATTQARSEQASDLAADTRDAVTLALGRPRGGPDHYLEALRLLCDVCGARQGHLYLRAKDASDAQSKNALQRVASFGGHGAAPLDLTRRADEYLTACTGGMATQTVALDELTSAEEASRALVGGVEYELLLLRTSPNEGLHIAGVVALGPFGELAPGARAPQLFASVAAHLLRMQAS